MGVGEMLGRMTSAEITEWHALLLIEREERLEREADSRARAALEQAEARARGR